jgi:hypothetical protein
MRRTPIKAVVLIALAAAGCGGGEAETASTSRPPRRSYGPAKSHPYWWASEVLLKEAEEVEARFEELRPGNLRGELNLIGQLEWLQRGCEDGYGVTGCRRGGEIDRIAAGMWREIVPPRRRHTGFNMALQIALLRYHQLRDEDGPRSISAQVAGLHALTLALHAHHDCKAIPTCPWERAARVEATLRSELTARGQAPTSRPTPSPRPPRYRPGNPNCRPHGRPGTVGVIGEDVAGGEVRVKDFVACFGPPVREHKAHDGRCLYYRQRGTNAYWRFCVRAGRIVSGRGNLSRPG